MLRLMPKSMVNDTRFMGGKSLKKFQLMNDSLGIGGAEHVAATDQHIDAGSDKTRSRFTLNATVNLDECMR